MRPTGEIPMFPHFGHGRRQSVRTSCVYVLASCLCALAVVLWVPAASAHASLIASAPAGHAVLERFPLQARLTFNEPVSPLVFKIVQPDGTALDLQRIHSDHDSLVIDLPKLSQSGTYALSWRVISTDGHPAGGSQIFSIGAASQNGPSTQASLARDAWIWMVRLAWLLGLMGSVGLALFQALLQTPGRGGQRGVGIPASARWMLAVGALAAPAGLGLLGVDALDTPLSGLLEPAPWRTALRTSFALSVAGSWGALTLAALSWRTSRAVLRTSLALAALATLGLTLAASGHASTAPPVWLAKPSVWLHTIAATAWVGLLLPLARALGHTPDLAALRRFSTVIPVVLLALVASGIALIWLQFDHPAALWHTAYGQVLMVKLALVAGLLLLGTHNRLQLTGPALAGDRGARRAMRRSIAAECVLAVLVLATLSLWRFTPPPRAIAAASATPSGTASMHIHTPEAMAQVVLDTHAEAHTLTLYLYKSDFTPLPAQAVDIALSSQEAGLEPVRYSAHPLPDGTWRVESLHLPHLAHWQLEIDVLVSDFDRVHLRTQMDVTP